ncbi:MAG: hypothetical protein R3Y53_01015 [Bacillota bacterium]
MGAFEFERPIQLSVRNNNCNTNCGCDDDGLRGPVSILAPKIFDQCRLQKCLTATELGPARMAHTTIGNRGDMCADGDIIIPPANATDVTIRDLELSEIEVLRKRLNALQEGCWDIDLKYVFTYFLEFRRIDGSIICVVEASNSYILKITLFGGTQSDITTISELSDICNEKKGRPCVYAEGKAIALAAELKYPNCGCGCNCHGSCGSHDGSVAAPVAVDVAIGLFTVVKLYRTVSIVVESLGTLLPEQCTPTTQNTNGPCDNFDRIPFPMELFTPSGETKSCCGIGEIYGSADCEYDNSESDCCSCDCDCGSKKPPHSHCGCR